MQSLVGGGELPAHGGDTPIPSARPLGEENVGGVCLTACDWFRNF